MARSGHHQMARTCDDMPGAGWWTGGGHSEYLVSLVGKLN
jgi:hypothetical protein